MADVVAEYLRRAGVEEGDWVAVNASASFPGFILASLCAVESMKANAQIAFSYGASMYGGTDPEFTFPVMLDLLNSEGLLSTRLAAVAPGGAGDRMAETLLEDPRPTVDLLLAYRSEKRIDAPDVAEAIRRRLEIFDDTPRPVKCFISCGGPVVALGTTEVVLELPHGLITRFEAIPKDPERGLLFDFLDRGTPVLHLLFVRGICEDFGIPYERVAGQ
jgi:poly-gamma-glutamate system protein